VRSMFHFRRKPRLEEDIGEAVRASSAGLIPFGKLRSVRPRGRLRWDNVNRPPFVPLIEAPSKKHYESREGPALLSEGEKITGL
jgi:hypothetical protein